MDSIEVISTLNFLHRLSICSKALLILSASALSNKNNSNNNDDDDDNDNSNNNNNNNNNNDNNNSNSNDKTSDGDDQAEERRGDRESVGGSVGEMDREGYTWLVC